ncbi:MAG: CDP-glucose 4,6-dehydratase [Acidobacteria bacterium]|nr:CDP-glucose 4,6-dehydratase [Acidobacteriota bacterium]
MRPKFWKDKKVLVTGHTGFKGSWLSLWLAELGAEVTGYSLPAPTNPSHFELARVAERVESINGDVRDLEHLCRTIKETRPEVVIHMAAQSLVRRSYLDPVETYETNVMGTVNVLEAVRRTGSDSVRALLVVTSDKCYENREQFEGHKETDAMGGYDPYSSSKGCAELVTAAFGRSFFHAAQTGKAQTMVASARAGNVIGGGDWAEDRLIPDIIRSWMKGEPVRIRRPHAVRPWQHVLDPLAGYLLLIEKMYGGGAQYAEGWNFGPQDSDAKPVGWIVERMAALWGEGARWALDEGEHPHEAHYLKLDCSKAREGLGWKARLSVERALEETVKWYRGYKEGRDAARLSLEQIRAFQNDWEEEVI